MAKESTEKLRRLYNSKKNQSTTIYDKAGYIYVFIEADWIKVGRTNSLARRHK